MIIGRDVGEDQTEFLEFKELVKAKEWSKIKEMDRWDQFSKDFLIFLSYIFESPP
jgi:hypothetical protein